MTRAHTLILSLLIAAIAVVGVYAAARTAGLGAASRSLSSAQVAKRSAALDAYEASLRRSLAAKTPALPALPSNASGTAAVTPRIVYHRPPPIVVVRHHGGEAYEAAEAAGGGDRSDD